MPVSRIIDRVTRLTGYLAAAVLALLIVLVVYDATVRYLLQSGSIALQELEWHLFDLVILLGIAYALKENAHVRVDIFYDGFPERIKAIVNLAGVFLFILPFSLLIIYVGADFVAMSFEQMECSSDPGGLPYRYLVKALIPLAFILLMLQAFSEAIRSWKSVRKDVS